MYGGFLRNQESADPQPPAEPQTLVPSAPSTAKKRHGFGRSSGRIEPLRIGAIPELSEIYSELSRNDRRSHGVLSNRDESHEWLQTNNTIPETLNSSREWNVPCRMVGNHSASQNDVRDFSASTPMKSAQADHSSLKAPVIMDKENFYTPRKTAEATPVNIPANRCPLSALTVESAPVKDTIDGINISVDSHHSNFGSGLEKNSLGSTQKNNASYDSGGFRTPQCKLALNQQNSLQKNGSFRSRMYGVSTLKMQPNIPLHPVVAAGQQQAKQLALQREAQYQGSTSIPSEASASRRLADSTPFKAAPTALSARQTPARPVLAAIECRSSTSDENVVSSASWMPPAKPVESTPFKPPSNHSSIPSGEATGNPPPLSTEGQSLDGPSLIEGKSSATTSSTWLPHWKNGAPSQYCGQRPATATENPQPCQSAGTQPLVCDPPSSKRKWEALSPPAEPLPEDQDQNSVLSTKLSPEPAQLSKPQQVVKIVEPAKVSVAPPTHGQEPTPPQQAVNTVEPAKAVSEEVAKSADCNAKKADSSEKKTCTPGTGQIAVNGHVYSILSLLGRGGSSKVFQVIDPENSQLKAVKCVNLAETDESICEGYLNEIKLLADLQDGDCVIRMFDHEHQKENKTLFVVMEKGDTDLSKLIKEVSKSKKISAAMIVYYWTEMLNAVSFIHKRGTIHSDLKPANFLLVSGRLKLIDFGIASAVQEDMTSVVKDSLTGTYNYISPEALCSTSSAGQTFKISYKSDVWSLGCILYNLVYGHTPFQHISGQFQKLNAIVNPSHRIQYPEPIVEGCPSALIQALKRCLVRNPKERASVDELLQLHYLEQAGPERGILSQLASLAASVGLVQESDDNRYAVVIRAMQRLIMENERHLPFLGGRK